MAGIPRSRGALSGGLLILLGGWGALVPFVGPYFGYAYTPDNAWHFTLARVWLEILPGGAAVLGGVLIMVSARRLLTGGGAIRMTAQGQALREGILGASARITGPMLATIDRDDLETTVRTLDEITRRARGIPARPATTEDNR